jgi:hypothetical protein
VETPRRQFQRVLLALEDLAAQEELLLRAEDFAAVPPLQARAAPLVDFLVAGANTADESLSTRVAALIGRRARSAELLSRQVDGVRAELSAMRTSRRRIAQVMPAYRQPDVAPSVGQLCARG